MRACVLLRRPALHSCRQDVIDANHRCSHAEHKADAHNHHSRGDADVDGRQGVASGSATTKMPSVAVTAHSDSMPMRVGTK